MGRYSTKYSSEWERSFSWLKKCPSDISAAFCKICNSTFKINGSGIAQVKSHGNSIKHVNISAALNGTSSQATFVNGSLELSKCRLQLTNEEQTLRAEILWALKCVEENFSFQSNDKNNLIFEKMFPDSAIAASYRMSQTKCKYFVQFGLYEFILEELKADMKEKPFSYKFDETTTSQVKKQNDAYIQYESKSLNKIVTRYIGSFFHGHCTAKQLLDDFRQFGSKMSWDVEYLLQISRDGPNTNKSLMSSLKAALKENHDKSIIDIGPCVLHTAHNGYKSGLAKLGFDFDGFAYDLWYFFKNSSARREDFQLTQLVTEIEAHVMIKHVSSRWLCIKKVSIRIIDQWPNLKDYFLEYLPKQKGFAKDVETTERYQKIRKYLTSKTSLIYLGFVVHVGDLFDGFMKLLQSSKPVIHVLYAGIGDLLFNLMANFVKQEKLVDSAKTKKDAAKLGNIDLSNNQILKSVHEIDFGKKAKHQIAMIENDTNVDVIKSEMKSCYIVLTSYLQKKLPHDNKLLADIQYIHPSKRNDKNAVSAIGRVAETFARVLKGTTFIKNISSDRYVDRIVQQFVSYQTETFGEHTSYVHWCKVGAMKNINDQLMYEDLSQLAKTVLCLSHANSDPERGFSENKYVLKDRGNLGEETIIAIRMVKDTLNNVEVTDFPIGRRLFQICSNARQKYFVFLEQQKIEKELLLKNKEKGLTESAQKKSQSEKLSDIEETLRLEEKKFVSAEQMIKDGNKIMADLVNSKGAVDKKQLIKAQMLVESGMEKVSNINFSISELRKQKENVLKNKK